MGHVDLMTYVYILSDYAENGAENVVAKARAARAQKPDRPSWLARGIGGVFGLIFGGVGLLIYWYVAVQLPAEDAACRKHGWYRYDIYKSSVCADPDGLLHVMPKQDTGP